MGLISPGDLDLVRVTDDATEATRSLLGFFRNYHSIRWVGNRLVIRMSSEITDDELADLNERFGHLCTEGAIERSGPFPPERSDDDHVELPRLALAFDVFQMAGLHHLVRAVNGLPGA